MFFSVGEVATSKWKHGEVAVYGSTVYKFLALKCQKLRTPLASLAPCVIKQKKKKNEINCCYKGLKRLFRDAITF